MSEPTNPQGEADEVYELPADVDLPDARLRAAAALLALPASIAVFVLADGTLARALALVGVAASIGWWTVARRARREASSRPPAAIRLESEEFVLVDGDSVRRLPWTRVAAVEIDEERVAVRLVTREGEETLVRPGYGRLGLLELHERIAARVDRSGDPTFEPGARTGVRG